MRLKLENIGMISHADIRLDGLTVIAGENDTGKSTAGKIIFSLVYALNCYEEDFNESKYTRISELIENTYFQLRKNYNFDEHKELQKEFVPRNLFRELKESKGFEVKLIEKKINLLEKTNDTKAIDQLKSIKIILQKNEDKSTIIKTVLTKILASEFYFELTPKISGLASLISLSEGLNNILDINISSNEISSLTLHDNLSFNDVTFIETPVFLQMYDLISSAFSLFEILGNKNKSDRPKITLHNKDLLLKLKNAQYHDLIGLNKNEEIIVEDIYNIINGKGFSFEPEEKDFYFNKDENTKFKSINTATGLKSFGMIQLLIQANVLNERSLLIIDEPEIHLHPK
ncbi:MAG: AAA family ATPase, partial [Methylococcaceae bacterium]|nr:AAA family ATPase [Methylococcaceae bacterium]